MISRTGSSSLGFSIVGGIDSPRGDSPIYVMNINQGSIAERDGRLKVCPYSCFDVTEQNSKCCTCTVFVSLFYHVMGKYFITQEF